MAILMGACAPRVEYPPPGADIRAQLHEITVASNGKFEGGIASLPNAIKGAGEGAGRAATGAGGAMMIGGLGATGECVRDSRGASGLLACPFIAVLGVALAVPAALGGAIYGATVTPSAEAVEASDKAAVEIAAALRPDIALQQRIGALLRDRAGTTYLDPVALTGEPSAADRHRAYAQAGIGAVLELDPPVVRFIGSGRFRPRLRIEMEVTARLIRTKDSHELYSRGWRYLSRTIRYTRIGEDRPTAFTGALAESYRLMAEKIVADLFDAAKPEIQFRNKGPTGEVFTIYASNSRALEYEAPDPPSDVDAGPAASAVRDEPRDCATSSDPRACY